MEAFLQIVWAVIQILGYVLWVLCLLAALVIALVLLALALLLIWSLIHAITVVVFGHIRTVRSIARRGLERSEWIWLSSCLSLVAGGVLWVVYTPALDWVNFAPVGYCLTGAVIVVLLYMAAADVGAYGIFNYKRIGTSTILEEFLERSWSRLVVWGTFLGGTILVLGLFRLLDSIVLFVWQLLVMLFWWTVVIGAIVLIVRMRSGMGALPSGGSGSSSTTTSDKQRKYPSGIGWMRDTRMNIDRLDPLTRQKPVLTDFSSWESHETYVHDDQGHAYRVLRRDGDTVYLEGDRGEKKIAELRAFKTMTPMFPTPNDEWWEVRDAKSSDHFPQK